MAIQVGKQRTNQAMTATSYIHKWCIFLTYLWTNSSFHNSSREDTIRVISWYIFSPSCICIKNKQNKNKSWLVKNSFPIKSKSWKMNSPQLVRRIKHGFQWVYQRLLDLLIPSIGQSIAHQGFWIFNELKVITLTLKMASARVAQTSVANNSPSQDSSHPDDHFQSRHGFHVISPIARNSSL